MKLLLRKTIVLLIALTMILSGSFVQTFAAEGTPVSTFDVTSEEQESGAAAESADEANEPAEQSVTDAEPGSAAESEGADGEAAIEVAADADNVSEDEGATESADITDDIKADGDTEEIKTDSSSESAEEEATEPAASDESSDIVKEQTVNAVVKAIKGSDAQRFWDSLMGKTEDGETSDYTDLEVKVSGLLPEGATAEVTYTEIESKGAETALYAFELTILGADGKNYVPEKPVSISINGKAMADAKSAGNSLVIYSYQENEDRADAYDKYAADVLVFTDGEGEAAWAKYSLYDKNAAYENGEDAVRYSEDKDGITFDKKTDAAEIKFAYGHSLDTTDGDKAAEEKVEKAAFVVSAQDPEAEEEALDAEAEKAEETAPAEETADEKKDDAAVAEAADNSEAAEVSEAKEDAAAPVVDEEAAAEAEANAKFSLWEKTFGVTKTATDNSTYKVTAKYSVDTGIPANADLFVTEVNAGSAAYDAYIEGAEHKLGQQSGSFTSARAFDISFRDHETGKIYQPDSSVSISIRLLDGKLGKDNEISVVHFPGTDAEKTAAEDIDAASAEVINVKAGGKTVDFEADSFSIYVVSETPTVTYEFYLDSACNTPYEFSLTGTNGTTVKTSKQILKNGDTLAEPERPINPEGQSPFKGWYRKSDDTRETGFGSAVSVTTAGETVQLYAYFGGVNYAVFHEHKTTKTVDGSNTEVWPVSNTIEVAEGTAIDLDSYEPNEEDYSREFIGWAASPEDAENGIVISDNYSNYTITEDTKFYPVFEGKVRVSFVTNLLEGGITGSGAPYVSAKQLTKGDQISGALPASDPEWKGYTFDGWFYDDSFTQSVSSSDTVREDKTVYAKWNPGPTTYAVALWKQKTTSTPNADLGPENYDFVASTVQNGTTGNSVTVQQNQVASLFPGESFAHFTFRAAETKGIAADGSTIINVYYDRDVYKLIIKNNSEKTYSGDLPTGYVEATDLAGDLYGTNSDKPASELTDSDVFRVSRQQVGWRTPNDSTNHNNLAIMTVNGRPVYPLSVEANSRRTNIFNTVLNPPQSEGTTVYLSSGDLGTRFRVEAEPYYAYIVGTSFSSNPIIYTGKLYNKAYGEATYTGLYQEEIPTEARDYSKYAYEFKDANDNNKWKAVTPISSFDYSGVSDTGGKSNITDDGKTWTIYVSDADTESVVRSAESYRLPAGMTISEFRSLIEAGRSPDLNATATNWPNDGMRVANPTTRFKGYSLYSYKTRIGNTTPVDWTEPVNIENNNPYTSGEVDVRFTNDGGYISSRYTNKVRTSSSPTISSTNKLRIQMLFVPVQQNVIFKPYGKADSAEVVLKAYTGNVLNYTVDGTQSDDSEYAKYTGHLNKKNDDGEPAPEKPDGTPIDPPEEGKIFAGWYLDETYTTPFDPDSTSINQTTYVYAKWEDPWYVAEIDPAGGVLGGGESGSTWVWRSEGQTVESYDSSITRDFDEHEDGSYYYHKRSYGYYGGTYNWDSDMSVGGIDITDTDQAPRTATYDTDSSAPTDGQKYRPMEKVWKLKGWNWQELDAHGNPSGGSGENYQFGTPVNSNIRITAVWEKVGTYTIVYDPGDGTLVSSRSRGSSGDPYGTDADFSDGSAALVTKSAKSNDDKKAFAGWKIKDAEGANAEALYQKGDTFTVDSTEADTDHVITLIAQYRNVGDTTDLIYDANDETVTGTLNDLTGDKLGKTQPGTVNATNKNKIDNILVNDTITLSEGLGMVKAGYRVVGWNTNKTAASEGTIEFEAGEDVVVGKIASSDSTENTLYAVWEPAICKIVDTDDGEEHPFPTLNAAVTYARQNGNGQAMSADNPVRIEMLVDYVIPQTDKVTLNGASDNIIITTAATSGGTYNFTPTFDDTQGRSSDDSDEIAILQRGFDAGTAVGNSLFYLNNSSAKLKTEDITIDGGYATESQYKGRAVYVNNGDVCFMGGTTVENCHLERGSFTEGRGSAVYVNNSGTHTIIDNSSDKDVVFRDCSVGGTGNYDGACINIQSGSVIINNSGSGTILFERINGNSDTDGGAIGIEGSGDLTVNNTEDGSIRFVDCTASYGGALETDSGDSGNITLNNSGTGSMEFLRCYTDNAHEGGAIYAGNNCTVINNGTINFTGTIGTDAETKTKTTNGGAIYAGSALSITGSGQTSFTNCKANGNGGAIYAKGSVTIDQTGGTSFTNCTGNNGGGVYGNSTVTVTNCSFTNCTASTGTGGGIHSVKQLSVSGSTFTDCSAKTNGGAIYIAGPNSTGRHTVSNCTFDGHKDLDENTVNAANGGAIYVYDGWLTLTGSQFSDLTCTTNGGAVYMGAAMSDTLTMEDCTFDGHDTLASTVKNASVGGAVYMNANNGITLKNLTVSDCWTSGNGGGVYADDVIESIEGTISIEDCYTTGGKGGGAYFNNKANLTGAETVTFNNCHADSTSTSNGGGGAWFNKTAKLDGTVTFEDCYTGGYGGAMYFVEGGTMTGVNVDGHKTLDAGTNNAAKGGAIFLANSKTLTINGGEIKNCSASNTNGGAINVGSSAKVYFEGDAVVYNNKSTKDGQEVQANMVLDQNYNTIINTTENGLGTGSHIGVYVTGNNANPYNSHGKEAQPFGTATNVNNPGGMQNVDRFTNDRKESLFGVSSGNANDKLIYWSKPICKIIDTNPDGGTQIGTSGNYEHPFNSLNEAVTYARNSFNNGSTMSASNPAKIEMLVDYVIPERDKVTLDQANDNIIITTAKIKSAAQAANETYYFEKSFTPAQGRQATDSDATAILKRGDSGASLFTVNNASASLSTEDIIFDGGGITANTHGGIVLGTKGAVTIRGGTTMRNSSVPSDKNGGAVYSPNESTGAVITIENAEGKTIEFINCTAGNGGAIKSYYKPLTVTNDGTLNFVNCDARHGGALFTEHNGADISITNTGTMLFDDCDATSGVGGAIGTYTGTSNVTITNISGSISFNDCSTSSTGGAISANGAVSITGDGETSFSGCTSSTSGGGIYASGAVTITETGGTEFTKCSAQTGGAIYSGGAATLTNVTCGKANTADSGCTATDKGGCVYVDSGAATLTDCNFYYGKAGANTNTSSAQGGGVAYYGSNELKILGGVFDHCSNESSRNVLGVGNGGAVYVDKNATKLTVDQSDDRRSSFTDCSAHRYGGAIHWESDGGTVEINNADFTNCHSEIKGGGAVFTDSTTTNISNCSFSGCYTESSDSNYGGGGAIYTNADNGTASSTISISDTTFSDCMVEKNGGAIQFNSTGTSATLTNVIVDGHTSGGLAAGTVNAELGSAIYSKGDLTIRQSGSGTSEIAGCTASDTNGGAVNVASGKHMYFEGDVVVFGNTGTGSLASQQKNVVLDEDTNTKIYTTTAGIGADAHIGVYVTGTATPAASETQPFKDHGSYKDDFGTYLGSTDNLDRFTNDRVNDANGDPLYGEVCPDHASDNLIRWTGYYNVAPTGVSHNYLPYILVLIAGAVLAAIAVIARRRRSAAEAEDSE